MVYFYAVKHSLGHIVTVRSGIYMKRFVYGLQNISEEMCCTSLLLLTLIFLHNEIMEVIYNECVRLRPCVGWVVKQLGFHISVI
jgi:hypothetical protein